MKWVFIALAFVIVGLIVIGLLLRKYKKFREEPGLLILTGFLLGTFTLVIFVIGLWNDGVIGPGLNYWSM